jgi:hypothetical protein
MSAIRRKVIDTVLVAAKKAVDQDQRQSTLEIHVVPWKKILQAR